MDFKTKEPWIMLAVFAGLFSIGYVFRPPSSPPAPSAAPSFSYDGYIAVPPNAKIATANAVDIWRDCIIYGIGQTDTPNESAATVADAAMAGCRKAETNLADKIFQGSKSLGPPQDARAMADGLVSDMRPRMRELAIRLVMSKRSSRAS